MIRRFAPKNRLSGDRGVLSPNLGPATHWAIRDDAALCGAKRVEDGAMLAVVIGDDGGIFRAAFTDLNVGWFHGWVMGEGDQVPV